MGRPRQPLPLAEGAFQGDQRALRKLLCHIAYWNEPVTPEDVAWWAAVVVAWPRVEDRPKRARIIRRGP